MRDENQRFNISIEALPVMLLVVTVCIVFGPTNAAGLYKWVDENGQIRYSDRLPPKQSKKKHQTLNDQGQVTSTKEDERPAEEREAEIEAERVAKKKAAAAAIIKKAQDQQDEVLLLTFSNEAELELARKSRLDVIDSVIELINKSIESTQKKLHVLEVNANENFISKGKDVPGGLAQKIEHFERKIESRNGQLKLKNSEKKKINEKYDFDLARFRLLKTGSN